MHRGRDRDIDMMPPARSELLSGWGRYPSAVCPLTEPGDIRAVMEGLARSPSGIARGMGRSYGDSSLNGSLVLGMGKLDRMLAFDPDTGVLTCESGITLADIIDVLLPRGWFPAVTPGTKFVTVGGMIAADVHGKNHHGAGSFCDHLLSLDLALGDGSVVTCSAERNLALFAATCGGMGLTGVILRATFRLQRVETSRIRQRTLRARNLDDAMAILDAAQDATYTVAWIDCLAGGDSLGRSLIFLGEHARIGELPEADRAAPLARPRRRARRVPIDFPAIALSWPSVRLFNALYYRSNRAGTSLVDLDPYFYPLDALADWNRIYGRRGFVQYQSVLPIAESAAGLRRMLAEVTRTGGASFLAVLKRLGRQSFGLMSFPRPGYTLALDFPATAGNLKLLDRLDAIVREHGGRIYLAKDARTSPAMIACGYPRLAAFQAVRRRHGLADRFCSLQSRRLEL